MFQMKFVIFIDEEDRGKRIAYCDSFFFMFIPNRYWTWIF